MISFHHFQESEARSSEQTLSQWFVQLGAVLTASERMRCECNLTAFSVHPSPAMYEKIKAAPELPPVALVSLTNYRSGTFYQTVSTQKYYTNFFIVYKSWILKKVVNELNFLNFSS